MNFEEMRIKDVSLVLRYRPNIKRWRTQNRKHHIIGIQLDGSALHDFGYKSFVLNGNSIFFFNRRDDYDVEILESGESFSIHFSTYEDVDCDSFCLSVASPDRIVSILRRAEHSKNSSDTLELLGSVYRLCAEFARLGEKNYSRKDSRMLSAKVYMDANFTDPDCIKEAVAQSGISRRRFGELFRQSFDTTPCHYVASKKMSLALSLLENKGLSVTEISDRCGFSDVYYFCKAFKSAFGVSPGKWKQSY